MMKIENSVRLFCDIHGIPLDRLFDAAGLKRCEYKEIMKLENKWAAYGVNFCGNSHSLRNRHGSCLICKPARVAFLLRVKMSGYLYIASGAGGNLMKLGFSGDPAQRIKIANYEQWGGYGDWCLRAFGWSVMAGSLECELHAEFYDERVPLPWDRNWRPTVTKESYKSDINGAVEKLTWLCDSPIEIVLPPWHDADA